MHGTHDYLAGLAQIHTRESVEERRALWRQGLASLAAAAADRQPTPLEGLDTEPLLSSVRVALSSGLLDDMSFLSRPVAMAALFELAGALPPGDEQMFLGMPNLINCENAGFDTCAPFGGSYNWPHSASVHLNPAPGLRPPAAAGRIVVYADAQGSLWYFSLSVQSEGWGDEAFGVSGLKAVGGPPVTGAPIAVKDDATGRILVFAPAKGPNNEYSLKRWEYDPVSDIWWLSGSDEYWSTNDKVVLTSVDLGLGVTTGRLSSDPAGQMTIFAAIPVLDTASGKPIIEIARLLRTQFTLPIAGTTMLADSWSRLDPGIWTEFNVSGSNRVTDVPGRLSLAFLPEGTEGRFYLAFRNSIEFITFTRGNVPWDGSGSRPAHALDFVVPAPFYNEWAYPSGGISLVTFTGKIRAAAVITEGDWASFFPNADGIYNSEQKDFDEVTYVANHMACALKHNCWN